MTDDQITAIERAINDGDYDRAIATLRTCKGRGDTPETEPMRCAECECSNGGAECTWIATPDTDTQDGYDQFWNAAIEADDHDLTAVFMAGESRGWSAAIEAAAKEAMDQERACTEWFQRTGQHCNVYEQFPIVASRIRALQKDHTHD